VHNFTSIETRRLIAAIVGVGVSKLTPTPRYVLMLHQVYYFPFTWPCLQQAQLASMGTPSLSPTPFDAGAGGGGNGSCPRQQPQQQQYGSEPLMQHCNGNGMDGNQQHQQLQQQHFMHAPSAAPTLPSCTSASTSIPPPSTMASLAMAPPSNSSNNTSAASSNHSSSHCSSHNSSLHLSNLSVDSSSASGGGASNGNSINPLGRMSPPPPYMSPQEVAYQMQGRVGGARARQPVKAHFMMAGSSPNPPFMHINSTMDYQNSGFQHGKSGGGS